MRNDDFLHHRLNHLWKRHFSDVPKSNHVNIKFGKKAVKRLGSIRQKLDETETLIILNGHFRDKSVPDYVLDATIIHELCHYTHGFSSPLPQLSRFTHKGGLVDREFSKRGLDELLEKEKKWLDEKWYNYIKQQYC